MFGLQGLGIIQWPSSGNKKETKEISQIDKQINGRFNTITQSLEQTDRDLENIHQKEKKKISSIFESLKS